MSTWGLVALAVLPWILLPLAILRQLGDAKMLDAYSPDIPADAPLVSVVIPARDEQRNIGECVQSILRSSWPYLEVIVVNDYSSDDTAMIARRIAARDARVRVIDAPDLPDGWFGKQWACHNGSLAARGTVLLFTDADTRHGADLLARSMNAMHERGADLFSVGGTQMMETFWERLLQPHIFAMILARFGATERMSRSIRPLNKIANGQFMLMLAETYRIAGGHEAVRRHVAEDLRMAQEWTRLGLSVHVVAGQDQLATRMYDGFREIALGWGKNLYAAGRETLPLGRAGQMVLRVLFPSPTLWEIVPASVVVAALCGVLPAAAGVWGALVYLVTTAYWMVMHHVMRAPLWYAWLHPLASCALFGIFARAAWNGDRVAWKGRAYVTA